MNERLLFIIYISYFIGLFLCAMMWSLAEGGVKKSGKNRSSIPGRGLSAHNPTSDVVAATIIFIFWGGGGLLRVKKYTVGCCHFSKT